jgi:carbonic anhydrase
MLHGVLVVVAALLMVPLLELIPLASLAALVMAVGIQMVSLHHIRTVTRHREVLVYVVTTLGVVCLGVLEGVGLGVAVAVAVALHRLTRTRITHEEKEGVHHVHVRGQLTFLAVPRLSRVLHLVPPGTHAVVKLDGSFMDHAAYESLQDWQRTHTGHGGTVELTGRRLGVGTADPTASLGNPTTVEPVEPSDGTAPVGPVGCRCRPWTPWRNHQCERPPLPPSPLPGSRPGGSTAPRAEKTSGPNQQSRPTAPANSVPSESERMASGRMASGLMTSGLAESRAAESGQTGAGLTPGRPIRSGAGGHQLVRGITAFQRNTAPLVRSELARLAQEGQQPSQLFLTCADSRLVTSMITSSGPGDLFVVRNVGNLVPLPGEESCDDSVAAAIEYAVDVLKVRSITVCGHSGCGAMQALLDSGPGDASTPLKRWLRHGLPSLERLADGSRPGARLTVRPSADTVEQLCLTNVVQQLDHLRAHDSVARALEEGALELHGMYFHVGEAQAYLLTEPDGSSVTFADVADTEELHSPV